MAVVEMRGYGMIEDENGEYFGETVTEVEIPDDQIRHCEFCTFCGNKSYPECIDICPSDYVRQIRDKIQKGSD